MYLDKCFFVKSVSYNFSLRHLSVKFLSWSLTFIMLDIAGSRKVRQRLELINSKE